MRLSSKPVVQRGQRHRGSASQFRQAATARSSGPRRKTSKQIRLLQLVLGDNRAEVSLDNLERLENWPLCQELGVVLRALTVVATTNILDRKMTDGIPTPAAGCCGIGVDGSRQLVVATVAHVAKAVEMSVLRLDEPEPGVPQRVSPVQGLEQRRVHITSAVCSESRSLPKPLDSVHVTADKPGTGCSSELTHLSRRRSCGPAVALDEFGGSREACQRSNYEMRGL
jgi:hypothetical protein